MNYEKNDMLTATFHDSYVILNRNTYLLCIKLRTVIRHFKIISRTRNYNNNSTIQMNTIINTGETSDTTT